MKWKPGDKVMWHFANARGQFLLVPGVVRAVHASRVTIEALFQIKGEPTKAKRNVKPDKLVARMQHIKELDDV